MALWFLLLLALVPGGNGQQNIFRDNYGVLFRDFGVIEFAHESWHHTFAVNMTFPEIQDMPVPCTMPDPTLHNSTSNYYVTLGKRKTHGAMCAVNRECTTPLLDMICPAILENRERHKLIHRKIVALEQEFDQLIPDVGSPRRARGLLNIVGDISKSLFGTATVKDQDVLKKHMEEISSMTEENANRITSLEDSLGSYLTKRSEHDELIEKAIQLNQEYINMTMLNVRSQALNIKIYVSDAINFLHLSHMHYVTTLEDIHDLLKRRVRGIHELLRGYLPTELVSLTELKDTLTHVGKELLKRDARLTHDNPAYYYHLNDVDYTRKGDILYIKLKIPITNTDAFFRLYYAQVVPIPLDGQHDRYSITKPDHELLAVDNDHQTYAVLSLRDYQFCTGNEFRRCDNLFRVNKASTPSCLFALFKGDSSTVHRMCETVLTDTPDDFALTLNVGQYYMSTKDETWSQKCAAKAPATVKACSHCVIHLACGCSLQGKNLYIPKLLEDCLNSTGPITSHNINLQSLLAFYGETEQLLEIEATKRYDEPVTVELPKFKIITDNYKGVVSKLKTEDTSLKKIADSIKKDSKIYSSPSAKLREDLGWFTTKHSDSLFGVSGLALLFASLALFLALRNCRVIMLSSGVGGLVIGRPTTTISPPDDREFEMLRFDTVTHLVGIAFMALLLLGCIIFMFVLARRLMEACLRQPPAPIHSAVYLVFYGKGRFAMTELTVYPGDIKKARISQRDDYKPPKITKQSCGMVFVTIFDWSFLDVRREDGRRITLPKSARFSALMTPDLKIVLEDPDEMKIVGCYNHSFYDMFVWKKPEASLMNNLISVNPSFLYDEEATNKLAHGANVV